MDIYGKQIQAQDASLHLKSIDTDTDAHDLQPIYRIHVDGRSAESLHRIIIIPYQGSIRRLQTTELSLVSFTPRGVNGS
jgi:hypothetical protein